MFNLGLILLLYNSHLEIQVSKRDFMFASSHLEDLNMKYTVNTNKNKIQVNWGKGTETILLVLMEKQSSCPSLLMRLPVLAGNHTYTLKQSH